MIDKKTFKNVLSSIVVGLVILYLIIALSEIIFGDLTDTASMIQLWIILPVLFFVAIVIAFYDKLYDYFNKK